MINITKAYLPNKKKYLSYVEKIYQSGWLTNNGPLLQELEEKLAQYLGVKNIVLVANGTVALEIAYRTLGIKGYAITTPFSFVATTSSLVTNGIQPIFVDIDKKTLNISAKNIEKYITVNTSAIVPTHIFGNICKVEEIEKIAKSKNLKVIYDASHCFGVKYKDKSILNYGDISTLSFHATKLFHTIEGGALIINDDNLVEKARHLRNFGIENEESIPALGTNAKMNEFEASMGLCMLDEIQDIHKKRKKIYKRYKKNLKAYVKFPKLHKNMTNNYAYFPIILKNKAQRIEVQKALNQADIYPRRYFYPSLDSLDYIEPKQFMPKSRDISQRILVLPFYASLEKEIQRDIMRIILEVLNG